MTSFLRNWLAQQDELSGKAWERAVLEEDSNHISYVLGWMWALANLNRALRSTLLWSPDLPTEQGWYWFRGKVTSWDSDTGGLYMIHVYTVFHETAFFISSDRVYGDWRGGWRKVEEPE